MKEIKERIQALEKMMGKNLEYDKGLVEGISALEDVNEIVDVQLDYLRGVAIGKEKTIRGMEKATAHRVYKELLEYFGDDSILEDDKEFKKWLERIKWYVKKADELYRKYECQKEPCEDAISREKLKKWLDMNFSFGGALRKIELFDRLDKELPSVTPTRKKGKWINKSHTSDCGIKFVASECTCCGKKTFFDCDQLVYNYCPNCGSFMENEVKSENM